MPDRRMRYCSTSPSRVCCSATRLATPPTGSKYALVVCAICTEHIWRNSAISRNFRRAATANLPTAGQPRRRFVYLQSRAEFFRGSCRRPGIPFHQRRPASAGRCTSRWPRHTRHPPGRFALPWRRHPARPGHARRGRAHGPRNDSPLRLCRQPTRRPPRRRQSGPIQRPTRPERPPGFVSSVRRRRGRSSAQLNWSPRAKLNTGHCVAYTYGILFFANATAQGATFSPLFSLPLPQDQQIVLPLSLSRTSEFLRPMATGLQRLSIDCRY
jgi:hypothetical protein